MVAVLAEKICLHILLFPLVILFTTLNSNPDVFPGFYTIYLATYWELPLGYPTATMT